MKYRILNILTFSLALFMAYICGGMNIYHYCCDACRSQGHNIFLTISCEEVHASHHCSEQGCNHETHTSLHVHENTNDLCSHLASKSKHCDVHHIDAPQLSQYQSIDLHFISPVTAICATPIISDNISIYNISGVNKINPDAPPIFNGRDIIVLKSSYLI